MKVCSDCKLEREDTEFNKHRNGLGSYCKDCSKKYHSKRNATDEMRKKRRDNNLKRRNVARVKVMEYLLNHPCEACKEADIVVLEFDHLRDKEFDIAFAISGGYSWSRVSKEIEKCRVLCANCHRRHTAKSRGWFKAL